MHEGGARWQAESGQVLLAFDKPRRSRPTRCRWSRCRRADRWRTTGAATSCRRPSRRSTSSRCDLDEADPERAEASYRQVIAQAPQHADAHINLGRILHERGDLRGRRGTLPARPLDPPARRDRPLQSRASRWRTGGRHADALEAYRARDRRRRAQRRRALQRRAPLRSGRATTPRRCATCASAGTSRAGSVSRPTRRDGERERPRPPCGGHGRALPSSHRR